MFPTLVRRLGGGAAARNPTAMAPPKLRNATAAARATARAPLTGVYNSRFKPKKVWPPDFSRLSKKDQFRFERRYKRRVKLATARPRWNRLVQLTQLFSVTFVLIYTVLFMEWDTGIQPFQGIRNKFWGTFGAFSQEQRYERRKSE